MITSRTVLETAAETGFRSEVVEKVLRLRGALEGLLLDLSPDQTWYP